MNTYLYHIHRPGMGLCDGYIGVSNNPKIRWKHHGYNDSHVGNAIRKYDDIQYTILDVFDNENDALFQERVLRPVETIGWNKAPGGSKPPVHWGHSRKPRLGMKNSPEHNAAISTANKGRKMSPEAIEKVRLANLGRKASEETKKKISKGQMNVSDTEKKRRSDMGREYRYDHTGRVQSAEERSRRSEANPYKGKKRELVECPHCKLVGGGSAMKQWHFNNCKQKRG